MKKAHLIILLYSLILVLNSCKEDASLTVSTTDFTFTNAINSRFLYISNEGEKTLEWEITELPGWLTPSSTTGSLDAAEEKEITLIADKYYTQGSYNGTFRLTSNGGDKEISVSFDLSFEVGLFPGIGIENISLFDTYNSVVEKLGEPNAYDSVHFPEYGYIMHLQIFDAPGIAVYVFNTSDEIFGNDLIEMIGVQYPFSGVTENNIGLGSPVNIITNVLGEPEQTHQSTYLYYYYMSKGIDFLIDEDRAGLIWIYSPLGDTLKKAEHLHRHPERMQIYK